MDQQTGSAPPSTGHLVRGLLFVVVAAGAVIALIAWIFVTFFAACGCTSPAPGFVGSPASAPALSISNGTTIPVVLVVNGIIVERVAPGGYEDPVAVQLPALPWSIETRSPTGRVLSRLTVHLGDVVFTTPDSNGHSSAQGRAVRVDLSCGRLDLWSGPPLLGPMFIPGPSGDCD